MIEPLAIVPHKLRRIAFTALAVMAPLSALSVPTSSAAVAASGVQSTERSAYVLLSPGSTSSTMSGSMEDLRRAQSLRSGREGLLYVRHQGSAYVIRDPAILREAQSIFEPQRTLGDRQSALGRQQAALGNRQAQLGAEQGRLGRQQAGAVPRQAVELGRQQNALGRQQNELGRQQNALGQQQAALGREQARLARLAEGRLHALVAEAVRRGAAQRVD